MPGSRGRSGQLEHSQGSLDDSRQVSFEQLLEVRRRFKGMERARECPARAVHEPLVHEAVQCNLLGDALRGQRVVPWPVEPGGLPVDEKFRLAVPPESVNRVLELEFRPGGIRAPVGPTDVCRQTGTNARPEDDDCNVCFGRTRHLLLKRRRRQQRLVLPKDGLEMQHVAKLRFEPADDAARDEALFGHISGGRYKHTERLERH